MASPKLTVRKFKPSKVPPPPPPDFDDGQGFFHWPTPHQTLLLSCLAGVIITLIVGGSLGALAEYSGRPLFPPRGITEGGLFFRKLQDYDRSLGGLPGAERPAAEQLSLLLDDLEKNALGVESHLSVLKRRRTLVRGGIGPEYDAPLAAYRASAVRAATLFSHSEPLAAVAAEALTLSALRDQPSPTLSGVIAGRVKEYGAVTGSDPRLAPLAFSVYVLAGDMGSPEKALTIPQGEQLLASVTGNAANTGRLSRNSLILDAAILRLLRKDPAGTMDQIRPLIDQAPGSAAKASETAVRFAAELYYDYSDLGGSSGLERSAELFAQFTDDMSIARRADALWLSGSRDQARRLWSVLAAPGSAGRPTGDPSILIRSLYNLGATAANAAEETAFLERLLGLNREHLYGVLRYTRLLSTARAIAILEDSGLAQQEALADLELLRRRQEGWPIDRVIPETWLLLNRHPQDATLYQWAGDYFDLQRRYDEIPHLLRTAERNGIEGSWLTLHRGLEYIRSGRVEDAERLYKTIPVNEAAWEINANLGRLMEAKQSYTSALEYYENAGIKVKKNTDAAVIQLRIARCLRALGREQESRRVLEYAQTLDKDNLNIRLELERSEAVLF
jgi:hypothetical protein